MTKANGSRYFCKIWEYVGDKKKKKKMTEAEQSFAKLLFCDKDIKKQTF